MAGPAEVVLLTDMELVGEYVVAGDNPAAVSIPSGHHTEHADYHNQQLCQPVVHAVVGGPQYPHLAAVTLALAVVDDSVGVQTVVDVDQ